MQQYIGLWRMAFKSPTKTKEVVKIPNWVECDLRITLSKENDKQALKQLKEFRKFAQTGKGDDSNCLDTEQFIPYPKKFKKLDEQRHKLKQAYKAKQDAAGYDKMTEKEKDKWREDNPDTSWDFKDGFNSGGYEWCNNNWGTKWGICHAELRDENFEYGELEYGFESAWGPPLPVILAMSKKFRLLNFELRYFECGAGFNGWYECANGKVIHNEEGNYYGDRGG